MKSKLIAGSAVLAVAVGGYWYYSPHIAMKAMQSAAQKQDADAFNERVDYPKLRESFKGQMSALMAEKVGDTSGAGAFGAMLGMAMVNQFVDALVRPEVVMRAMQSGEFQLKGGANNGTAESGTPSKKVDWRIERKGVDKVIAYAMEPGQPTDAKATGLVFERQGFTDWKLTEIRLSR